MTGSNILLDTNIIIEIFSGNRSVARNLEQFSGFYISAVTLGELYVGINRVTNKSKHLRTLHAFLELSTLLSIDERTAALYGQIVASLYKKGRPIPSNDIWIAASAMQLNLTLITRDKHFYEIPDLAIERW